MSARDLAKAMLGRAAGLLPRARCGRVRLLPLLHVERLHEKANLEAALKLSEGYRRISGKRALMTVITPLSPHLGERLAEAEVSEEAYAGFVKELGEIADVGLHGHYYRAGRRAGGPCHAQWSERALIFDQARREWAWLHERGLLSAPAYSAGWWFLDDTVTAAVEAAGARLDFSLCAGPYQMSTKSRELLKAGVRPGTLTPLGPDLTGVWTLQALPARSVSEGALRFVDAALSAPAGEARYFGLYAHDYDLNPEMALETLEWCAGRGFGFFDCGDLAARGAENRAVAAA